MAIYELPSPFQVFQNLQQFMEDKDPRDDLFDALTVSMHISAVIVS